MDGFDFGDIALEIAAGIGALVFVYLLFKNPDAVVGEFRALGGFVVAETKQLQGL